MNDFTTDVLIVGAGPTGLTAALELARRHVRVRIIEKHSERRSTSKALVVQARTLELMDIAGLADAFLRRGYPAPGLNISLGMREPVSIDLQHLNTRFPYLLVLPQNDTEEILEAGLRNAGVSIERGVEFTALPQCTDVSCTAEVRSADGQTKIVTAPYVIGCDGAHSAVRQAVNLPFTGKSFDNVVFLADVKLDAEFIRSRITNFTSPRGFVSVLPFLGDYSRIFAVDFTKQDSGPSEPLDLADLQETVDAIAHIKLTFREPRWITRFLSPSRQVPTNRVGNVFLAGDAAHAHSPAGGQGMNSGMQDAFNLCWKLAMVLQDQGSAELLSSYDAERHPIDAQIQRQTDAMFSTFLVRNPALKTIRDWGVGALMALQPIRRRLAGELSNIAINYRFAQKSLAKMPAGLPRDAIQAGDRVPDVDLWAAGNPQTRLYELLRDPRPALFAFATASRFSRDRDRLFSVLGSIDRSCGGVLNPSVVLDEGVPERGRASANVFVDYKGQFRDKLGARHGSMLLVRPDGYLAFHQVGFDFTELSRALASWIRFGAQPGTSERPPSLTHAA